MLNGVDVITLNPGSSNLKNDSILNILCDTWSYLFESQASQGVVIVCHLGRCIHWLCDRGVTLSATICRSYMLSYLYNKENPSPDTFPPYNAYGVLHTPEGSQRGSGWNGESAAEDPCSATAWLVNLGKDVPFSVYLSVCSYVKYGGCARKSVRSLLVLKYLSSGTGKIQAVGFTQYLFNHQQWSLWVFTLCWTLC